MAYSIKEFGINTKRRNYQKTERNLEVFDLLKIQKEEFLKFLHNGIEEVIREIYPIYSTKEKIKVEFLSLKIDLPNDSEEKIKDAKAKGSNFFIPIKATFRMINQKDGEIIDEKEAFLLNLPLITDKGSFIINGSERLIISQIVRAPGVYFEKMKAARAQSTSDSSVFKIITVIPDRGSWIELDYKDYKLLKIDPTDIKLRIDKSKRIRAIILLNALGLKNDEILKLFDNNPLIIESIKKVKTKDSDPFTARKLIFKLVNSGDRFAKREINELIYNLFLNKKRYDFSETGRYKINAKLSPKNRLRDKVLAEDLLTLDGKLIFKKDTLINLEKAEVVQKHWRNNNLPFADYTIDDEVLGQKNSQMSEEEKNIFTKVHIIKVYSTLPEDEKKPLNERSIFNLISVPYTDKQHLTIADLIATFGYLVNLEEEMFEYDDIDSLSNRKIKTVNELLKNQFRIGLTKMEKNLRDRISSKDTSNVTIKNATNHKLMESVFKEFFNSSQLSQFMDQVNPLAEISNKRRLTSLGPGGLSRDTASLVVRGIHDTHYGRIDPIETPEGPNIGLILNLAIYAKINKYGLIETPYYTVKNGKVNYNDVVFLISDEEKDHVIAPGNTIVKNGEIVKNDLVARLNGSFVNVKKSEVTLIDVSPRQIVSIATSHIPFLENDDANRALMGANMQRQAIPLIQSEAPIVATGIEEASAKFSPTITNSMEDGIVEEASSERVVVKGEKRRIYELKKFRRSNQATSINQRPIVKNGDKVKAGQPLTDGPSIDNGEMAIGKNVLVAFTTWRGYNYEDAIIISERLVKDDIYTSLHIEEHRLEQRSTKLGEEKITRDIPNASKESMRNLDSEGIIVVGSEVKVGDVLVGKITPKGEDDASPEEKLLDAILGNKSKNTKDSSLRLPYGAEGIVQDVQILSRKDGDKLDDGVEKIVKVYIAQKRKIKEGDKMSGRHGNKGVVSRILPEEDMPYLEDGTPIDIMLNPLGVPSRMNIGQVLEVHLGMAAKKLNIKVSTPIFDGVNSEDLSEILKEANIDESGKFTLVDGITGRKYDNKVAVGIMYMLKLSHMIDDKMHARSIGPYSLITQQPLRGKSQNGGQRFGEMEAWALEAYGASNLLQEMITLKSDDIKGRNELYNSISKGKKIPKPNIPEGFWVLYYELRGLGLGLDFLNEKGEEIEIDNSI